jgi:hypothetical protein
VTPQITNTLVDHRADLVLQAGELAVVRTQDVPDWWMDSLRDARLASRQRAGETHRVCAVPTALAEQWLRQGFDVYREPAKAIVKRLRDEGYHQFIATEKRI